MLLFFSMCENRETKHQAHLLFIMKYAGVAGLAVAYGLNLNIMQTWVVQCLCFMENSIIAVERMLQYTCIPPEPPLVVESNRPERQWPMQGEVHVQDLQVTLHST